MAGVVLGHPGEFPGEPVQLGQVLPRLAQGLVQDGRDGGADLEGHLLVEEAEVVGAGDTTRIGVVRAGEQAQQGGLADAVLPDQADAMTWGGRQGDAVEDPAPAQVANKGMGEKCVLGHDRSILRDRWSARRAHGLGRGPRHTSEAHTPGAPTSCSVPSASRSHRLIPISARNRSSWLTTMNAPW
ncbi:hypothetical protein SVIRM249S_06902 [Streptomyces viridochromogenes]